MLIYVPAQYYEAYRTGWSRTGYGSLIRVMVDESGVEEVGMEAPADLYDVFNLDGQLVKRRASQSDIDALSPGIYIINGKKMVVK